MRLIDFLDKGAALSPDAVCVSNEEYSLTYRQAVDLTHRIANALHANGVKPGDLAGVLSPNDPLGYVTILGVMRAGCAWLPLNPRNDRETNSYILQDSGASFLFWHNALGEDAAALLNAAPNIRQNQRIDGDAGVIAWSGGFTAISPDPIEDREAPVLVMQTGGTTGRPKLIYLPNRSLETMVATYFMKMPACDQARHLVVAPMTHAAGISTFPLLETAGEQIFISKVDPGEILRVIDEKKITHIFLPPTVIYMMLAHPNLKKYDYSSLKMFLYAAAPMSADKLRDAIEAFGPVMTQCFGQAEAPMVCTWMTADEHMKALEDGGARLKSCGRPTPLVRLEIMDDDGNILPRGERGEIVVRGNLVMTGYKDNPAANEEASVHGWHHTGDVGYMDEEGYVFIVDRKKDMIISGGFNVFPGEVEQIIWTHDAVQDCAVIGVPDEKWGEAVKAVIELKAGMSATEDEIIALCREKLGGVRTPKSVEFMDELPRSPVGKVLKKTIRAPYWEGHERAI